MKKQQRESSTESTSLFPTLPEKLIQQILLRLPVSSLLRFKCVCKSWFACISDPQFAKSNFDLAASPTHRLLLSKTTRFDLAANPSDFIESLDTDSSLHDKSVAVHLQFPLAPPPPLGSRSFDRDFKVLDRNFNFRVLGSCRGFMLLANYYNIVVWNPSTGLQRRISESFGDLEFLYGLGYDESRDDYLIVFIESNELVVANCRPQIKIFSLKADSRFLFGVNAEYVDLGSDFRPGLFLNGSLHWLVKSRFTKLRVVLAFDLREGSLLEIALPHDLAVGLLHDKKEYYLRVMRERLCFCYSFSGGVTEIWMMKEYKVQSSWTKIVLSTYDLVLSTDDSVLSTYDILHRSFFPICFTKCGDVFGSNENGRLMKLNDKGELLEKRLFGLTKSLVHTRMYTESLLSLPDPDPEIVTEYYPPFSGFEEEGRANGQHPGDFEQVIEDYQLANEDIHFEEGIADGQHPAHLDQAIEEGQQANEDDQQPIYVEEAIVDDHHPSDSDEVGGDD